MTGFKDRIDNIPVRPGTSVLVELFSHSSENRNLYAPLRRSPQISAVGRVLRKTAKYSWPQYPWVLHPGTQPTLEKIGKSIASEPKLHRLVLITIP
jgi:hypothetical protein